MMEFKIKLPKNPVNTEEVKQRNRKMFSEDIERGILGKVFIFTQINQPVSNDDLKELLQDYYHLEFDKNRIKIATKRLNDLGLLHSITSGDLMTLPQNEHSDLFREAYKKFFKFLDHIPKQFRKSYTRITYYWVSDEGKEYVEWVCKLLNFEVEKSK